MIFANVWVQGLILIGFLSLFMVTYILNKNTKTPPGAEVPEKCSTCATDSCIVKMSSLEDIKKELKAEIKKATDECEE